jgi:hypothetical protein
MRKALLAFPVLAAACAAPSQPSTAPAPQAVVLRGGAAYLDAYRAAPASRGLAQPDLATGTVTALDDQLGSPRFVWARRGAAPPAGVATPEDAARAYAAANAAAYGLDAGALASIEVIRTHDLGHGAIVVELGQRVGGIEVYRVKLSVVMRRDLSLIALTGNLHPLARAGAAPVFTRSADDAIAHALTDVRGAPAFQAFAGQRGEWTMYGVGGLDRPARARPIWFALPDRLVPAWLTEVAWRDGNQLRDYRHVIADDDGRVLLRGDRTADDVAFRVWADPADLRPLEGPVAKSLPNPTGTPNGYSAALIPPNLVSVAGLNHAPGGGADPWLPANPSSLLQGNNTHAYDDIDSIDHLSAGDVTVDATGPNAFDRTYDTSMDPQASKDQEKAAVTEMFYVTNYLHDFWYDSGLDEQAGVAQASNYGRGGAEGDPLLAEGQDSSGTDNANMDTPDDGYSPVMQMYVFSAPSGQARRDGTIDNMVIEHEFGHYVHLRMVNCESQQCFGMSEGNADFDALINQVRAGDDLHGTYAMGVYVTEGITSNAAYFGIRRYPYSIDTTKNALTFADMISGHPLPAGVPMNPTFAGDNFEVHDLGEVWCSMLWEGLVAILQESEGATPRFTFEQARRRMADYYLAGLAAAPVDPTFTEQRDAILAAAAAADPTDGQLLAEAFARRGFGSAAVSPPLSSSSGAGIVESFTTGGHITIDGVALTETQPACDDDGWLDVGETGALAITVHNTGGAPLTAAQIAVTSTTDGVVFPSGATAAVPTLAAGATTVVNVPVRLEEVDPQPSSLAATITVSDPSALAITRDVAFAINRDAGPPSATDDVESATTAWTVDGGGWARVDSAAAGSMAWAVPDPDAAVDQRLVSPPLAVTGDLTLSFRTRYHFDTSLYQGTNGPTGLRYDGGVLEISADNGATWQDASTFGDPHYGQALAPGGDNPLAGHATWSGANPDWPAMTSLSVDLGPSFAGKTVRVRFRFASNSHWNDAGWELDDLAFGGVSSTPFASTIDETGSCLPGMRPIADAGPDQDVPGGSTVTLDGTASHDPDGGAVTYLWSQVDGIIVTLSDPTAAKPTFDAPVVMHKRPVTFQLVVHDTDLRVSVPDQVVVTIDPPAPDAMVPPDNFPDAMPDARIPPAGGPDGGTNVPGGNDGCGCGASRPRGGDALVLVAVVAILARRRRRND